MSTGAHRALPDVLAMERVFAHPSLVACMSHIPIMSPKQQMSLWTKQKRKFNRTTALIRSLGKPSITSAQANRLHVLGFTYQSLLKLRSECKGTEVFLKILKDKGVNSKVVRDKLAKQLQ